MRHTLTKVLPYTPDQLFRLVGDVETYPQFVPWLTSMRTWNKREDSASVSSLDAEAGVGFSFLRERFSTHVRRDAVSRTVEVGLIRGPFKRLQNRWRFLPHPQGARVEFEIDFQFKSRLLDALLAANMDQAVRRLVACFEARAAELYGAPAAAAPASDQPTA